MENLKHKTIKGLFWSFAESFGVYIVKFGFSVAIARLLSPEDYGLVGMIAIFAALSIMITESGFSMALIQKKDADNIDYSTIFFFNIFIALILYSLIFFSAETIADFYKQPKLVWITRISSISIILSSLTLVQYTILNKNLNFKKQAKINMFASLISGITGLFLAYKGYGVWALVIMTLSGNSIKTLLFWTTSNWHPNFIFSIKSFKSLYNYGYKIFLQGLSETLFRNIYYPIIGKFFSATQLGFYTRANKFYDVFVTRITIAYGKVTFPVFSKIQNENEKFRRIYIKTFRLLLYTLTPFNVMLLLYAKPFVRFFLSDKWMAVVPFMMIFFIAGFFFPLLMLNQNSFNAKGKSNISLLIDTIKKILTLISIFIFFKFGISGLIIGQVGSSFLVFIISNFFIWRFLKVNVFLLISEIIPIILIMLPGMALDRLVIVKYVNNDFLYMFLSSLSFSIIYLLMSKIFNLTGFKEVYLLAKPYISKRVKKNVR